MLPLQVASEFDSTEEACSTARYSSSGACQGIGQAYGSSGRPILRWSSLTQRRRCRGGSQSRLLSPTTYYCPLSDEDSPAPGSLGAVGARRHQTIWWFVSTVAKLRVLLLTCRWTTEFMSVNHDGVECVPACGVHMAKRGGLSLSVSTAAWLYSNFYSKVGVQQRSSWPQL